MAEMTAAEAIRTALVEELERDPAVILLGEDIARYGGAFRVTRDLVDRFGPQRVINTPISENTLAMDQLVNHAAKLHYIYGGQVSVPLVVRCPAGAGRGYGASHSQSLEAWFVHTPGLKVVAPSNPRDARRLLKAAIRDDNPVIFLENKLLYGVRGEVPDHDEPLPLGQAAVARAGEDVTLVAYARMTGLALEAAAALDEAGISCEVIDLRSLWPLDVATLLASVAKTSRAVIVEEDTRRGGVGAELAALLAEEAYEHLDSPIRRVACDDVPIPCSPTLEQAVLPSVAKIVAAVESLI